MLRNEAREKHESVDEHTVMACSGSVIQYYPDYRDSCQKFLDALIERSNGKAGCLELTTAVESSILGAAVAVACIDEEKEIS